MSNAFRLGSSFSWFAAILFSASVGGVGPIVLAQPGDSTPRVESDWQFETLTHTNGEKLVGFVQQITEYEVEFVQVFRRAGKPMTATVRVIPPHDVAQLERLPPDVLYQMLQRFRAFKHRAAIEAGSMMELTLAARLLDGHPWWRYEGRWFALDSSADERATRRCIVRIEQMFRAYQQLLPPRVRPNERLRIVLHGSLDEYQTALRAQGLNIANLAFYAPSDDLIVAGAELSSYAQELARIRGVHQAELIQVQRDYDSFRSRLQGLSERLADEGVSPAQIREETTLRTAAWNRGHEKLLRHIRATNRSNAAKFDEITSRMFRRLYHEAFHAYLDRFVLTPQHPPIDRWFNEGLAQVFEAGQLDGDTLRIDAPDRESLRKLQHDLTGESPLTLTQLLAANELDFLRAHNDGSSQRHYLYAWGLAYYLTIEQGMLQDGKLALYLTAEDESSVARLEELTGQPLAELERQWRKAMLRLQ